MKLKTKFYFLYILNKSFSNIFCIRVLLFRRIIAVYTLNLFLIFYDLFLLSFFRFPNIRMKLTKFLEIFPNIDDLLLWSLFFWKFLNLFRRWDVYRLDIVLTRIALLKPFVVLFNVSKPYGKYIWWNHSQYWTYSHSDCTPTYPNDIVHHIHTERIICKLKAINYVSTIWRD